MQQRCAHALAAFAYGRFRQPHDVKGRQAQADMDLDLYLGGVQAHQGARTDNGKLGHDVSG